MRGNEFVTSQKLSVTNLVSRIHYFFVCKVIRETPGRAKRACVTVLVVSVFRELSGSVWHAHRGSLARKTLRSAAETREWRTDGWQERATLPRFSGGREKIVFAFRRA